MARALLGAWSGTTGRVFGLVDFGSLPVERQPASIV
jgi:hypothetical protein